jgi:hypothetical protein
MTTVAGFTPIDWRYVLTAVLVDRSTLEPLEVAAVPAEVSIEAAATRAATTPTSLRFTVSPLLKKYDAGLK